MSFFNPSDLVYKDYQWQTQNDPKLRGNPDHSLFSRKEGWEVLYLIIKFGEMYKLETIDVGKKLERMIHDHLSSDVRSQENVRQWLSNNWSKY